jgi:hypothetical protein
MLTILHIDLVSPVAGHDSDDEPYPNSLIPRPDDHDDLLPEPVANEPTQEMGFWRRQFDSHITRKQNNFDWIFGVFLPVICFYLDPIVFRTKFNQPPLLGRIATFADVLSFTAILATMAWLLGGEKLKWLNASLAGIFAVSAVVAFVIGICISPFSLMGLIIVIGALGFTPLFSSFVFFRNSIRAFRAAKLFMDKEVAVNAFILAAVASAVIPYLINLL